jgi:hypothetical protein
MTSDCITVVEETSYSHDPHYPFSHNSFAASAPLSLKTIAIRESQRHPRNAAPSVKPSPSVRNIIILSKFGAIAEQQEEVGASVMRPSVGRVLQDAHEFGAMTSNAAHKKAQQATQ